jgi:hypothetical protein
MVSEYSELAAVHLGHKRMMATDEHYNDRDMDDLKRAAELTERRPTDVGF